VAIVWQHPTHANAAISLVRDWLIPHIHAHTHTHSLCFGHVQRVLLPRERERVCVSICICTHTNSLMRCILRFAVESACCFPVCVCVCVCCYLCMHTRKFSHTQIRCRECVLLPIHIKKSLKVKEGFRVPKP
jgi:hypothetical protein